MSAEEKVKAMEIVRNFLLRKLHLYGARLCPSYGGWSGKLGGQASVSCDYEHMYCGNRRDCSISLGGPGHDIEYEVLFADVPPEQAALIDQLFKLAKKDTATKEIKELKGVQETLTQKIDELSVVEAGWTAEELAAVLHDEDNGDQRCDGSSNCV